MKKQAKRFLVLLTALVMVTSLLCGCAAAPTAPAAPAASTETAAPTAEPEAVTEDVYITWVGGTSTGEPYMYWVAVTNAIQQVYPELKITVIEAQGGVDVAQRVRAGTGDGGNAVSNVDYQNYNGIGSFEADGPLEDLRLLWYYDDRPLQFLVSDNLDIEYCNQLDGSVKFSPGGTGIASAALTMNIFESLGIIPKYFEASFSDAIDAFSSRSIDGITVNGSVPENNVVKILGARSVKFIGFTEDEMTSILEDFPYATRSCIPANAYGEGLPVEDIPTVSTTQGGMTRSSLMSQETGYKFISAMMSDAGRTVWESAYPKGANVDVVQLTLNAARMPLHAGVVQYLVENGYEVPEDLIPPEYVPVA